MPTHGINCPTAVLTLVDQHGCSSRPKVLLAAARAVCERPPPAPVAYPTLTVAARGVSLRMTDDLHAATRLVERRYFYGRGAWALFYALVHYTDRIDELLRLNAEALARFDARVLQLQTSEVSPCPVPLTTRSPRAPKKPRRPRS